MIKSYQDSTGSPEERADDLLSKMNLAEKVAQLSCYNPKDRQGPNLEHDFKDGVGSVAFLAAAWYKSPEEVAEKLNDYQHKAIANSRWRIPALFQIETLTGGLMPGATSFPSGIGRGAAWNPKLETAMGQSVGRQMRTYGIRQALSPVLDVSRDARFGRQGESYGEDPTLVAKLGTAFTQGVQTDHNMMATAKHYLGYHGGLGGIHAAQVEIPERELLEVYAKPFNASINIGHLGSLMNAYSTVNGESVLTSKHFLQDKLRQEMKFNGLLVSDYASMAELVTRLHLAENNDVAAKRVLEAGFEIELPSPVLFNDRLIKLVQQGDLSEKLINRAVKRLLVKKFELGLFEQPFALPTDDQDNATDVAANETSLDYARESLVLLKNNGVLPLDRHNHKRVALIGHHMKSMRSLFGGYSYMSVLELAMGTRNTMAGIGKEKAIDQPLVTYPGSNIEVEHPKLEAKATQVYPGCRNLYDEFVTQCPQIDFHYNYGYPYIGDSHDDFEAALKNAAASDLAIVTVGGKYGWGTSCTTGEGIDAANINLPKCQEDFLNELGKRQVPFIVIHLDGRPISSDAADKYAAAIVEAWTPGQYGSRAIVEAITGQINPSAKLPVSVAYEASQLPLFYNHSNGSSYDVNTQTYFSSYIDLPHEPRYYFGQGLSYTSFEYANLSMKQAKIDLTTPLEFSIDITNTGNRTGQEIVQAYVSDQAASLVRPVSELIGFYKVELAPHESKRLNFKLSASQLAFLNSEMKWQVEAGTFDLKLGAASNDVKEQATFDVTKTAIIERAKQKMWTDVTEEVLG